MRHGVNLAEPSIKNKKLTEIKIDQLSVKRTLLIPIFIFALTIVVNAQEFHADSLAPKSIKKIDEQSDRLLTPLQSKANDVVDTLDNANNRLRSAIHNVNTKVVAPSQIIDTLDYVTRLSTTKQKLTAKVDSLRQLGLPHEKYSKALDSLNRFNPATVVQKVDEKISDTQSKIQNKVSQPTKNINEKLNVLRSETDGQGNIPGSINLDVPQVDTNLSDALTKPNGTATNLMPDKKIGDLGKVDLRNPDVKLPSVNTEAAQKGLGEVSEVSDKISAYSEDVKNIGGGNLSNVQAVDKDVLAKLESEELNVVKENASLLEDQKDKVRALRNQEAFKKATLAKARDIVTQQLASQQSQITAAVQKISEHQKRAGSLFQKVKDLPKRPRKEKKPPVIERFVPGITLQIQKTNHWFLDVNPTLRYRFRSIFSAGVGWNERIEFDKDFDFYNKNRVYGIRTFYELSVRKGLHFRADVERMNAFVPIDRTQQDIGERRNVWSYMAGIKKEFSFVPGVIGNAQFMYNLYDPHRTSPYYNRFNVRIAFEFPMKKKGNQH